MTEKQDMGVVTQCDREAATGILYCAAPNSFTADGQYKLDMELVAQAFRDHRLASQADQAHVIRNLPFDVNDDYDEVRRDERERIIAALGIQASGKEGHWLEPYRTMDAGGSPDTVGQVGHSWLIDIARAEHDNDPAALEIDMPRLTEDGTAQILYRGPKILAACFIVRDPMNFAILFRYRATHPQPSQKGEGDE